MEVFEKERDEKGRVICGADGKPKETFVPLSFPKIATKEVTITCQKHGKVLAQAFVYNGQTRADCPLCEKEREEKEEQERQQREAERKRLAFEAEMKERNVEPEFWNKNFDGYKVKTAEQKTPWKNSLRRKRGRLFFSAQTV